MIDRRVGIEIYHADGFAIRAFGFSADGRRFAILSFEALTVHDLESQAEVFRVSTSSISPVLFCVGFTSDGLTVVAADEDLGSGKPKYAWNLQSKHEVPWPSQPKIWYGRGLARDGSKFRTGGWPGPTPRICDTITRERITYCYHNEWPVFISFTPDSQNLVTLHEDGAMFFWELRPTENDNAKKLRFATAPELQSQTALTLLSQSNDVAYADQNGRVFVRPIRWQLATR